MKEIAIIHFIGLCLFTDLATSDHKLHVILPRIQATGISHQLNLQASRIPRDAVQFQQPHVTPGLGNVENHTAFLAFRDQDLLNVQGWTAQPLPGQPGYKYIVLNGETLTFNANAANVASVKPSDLPSVKCCANQNLLAGFKPSDGGAAAAIVRVPEGALATCSSQPAGAIYGNDYRIDTRLTLENTGGVMVWGDTKQKARALVLKGNATLYIANLPSKWVLNQPYANTHGGTPHYRAYTAMFTHTTGTACPAKNPTMNGAPGRCGSIDTAFRFGDSIPPGSAKKIGVNSGASINSECSNSSWP